MHDFDNTINKVLDFAEKDGNTLVIVTADHETGGLTMIDPNGRYTETCFKFSTGSHSPLLVPLFAFGPGADEFSGIIENTDIIKIILNIIE
jgi:alkaline phosphatase